MTDGFTPAPRDQEPLPDDLARPRRDASTIAGIVVASALLVAVAGLLIHGIGLIA